MDELVRWLGEQLDEDEQIAQAAAHLSGSLSGGGPDVGKRWRVSGSHADDGGTYWSVTTSSPDLDRIPVVEMVGGGMSGGGAHTEEAAAHIAEHDPARVLVEVEATREFVRLAERARDYAPTFTSGFAAAMEQGLRLFALAYADRPGYREEWRP